MATDFRFRNQQSELMDDPSIDDKVHRQALAGLRRINWWSRTDSAIWRYLSKFTASATNTSPLTILDIASGGGDLAIRLAKIAESKKVSVRIHGCDISPTAISCATEQAAVQQAGNVSFHCCNALEDPLPLPKYDVVMCSLFLHHLTSEQAVVLLDRMRSAARKLVLVNDLRRTRMGYWLAWLGCRILTRCYVVHVDGPMSVEGAFTSNEAVSIATQAGLRNLSITHHWPQRFILTSVIDEPVSDA